MLFQFVQTVYWLGLSVWFGGAMFIGLAVQKIHKTVRENNPILPQVLSVNLEGQHSMLLAGSIIGELITALARIEVICGAIVLVMLGCQWFVIDLADPWSKSAAIVRSALGVAALGVVIYDGWFLWPKISKARRTFIENADDPDKANPISEQLDRLQRDSEMLLMVQVFLLLGVILFSGEIHPQTFSFHLG